MKHDIKMVFRNLRGQIPQVFLTTISLVLAYMVCLIIGGRLIYEFRYDHWGNHSNQIYRINLINQNGNIQRITPGSIKTEICNKIPDILLTGRIMSVFMPESIIINRNTFQTSVAAIDPEIFDIFRRKFIHGSASTSLNDLFDVVITKSAAEKYYGTVDVIGQNLRFDEDAVYIIKGVIENHSIPTHLRPFEIFIKLPESWIDRDWKADYFNTFIVLSSKGDFKKVESLIKTVWTDNAKKRAESELQFIPELQSIHSLHFTDSQNSAFSATDGKEGDGFSTVLILISTLLLIILLAVFNYLNILVSRLEKRNAQAGVMRYFGAERKFFLGQYILESVIINLIALIFVVLSLLLLKTTFIKLMGIPEQYHHSLQSISFILFIFLFPFILSIISAFPIAYQVTNTSLIKQLHQGGFVLGIMRGWQKVLILIQLILVIGLLVFQYGVVQQILFMQHTSLGFNPDNILCLKLHRHFEESEIERISILIQKFPYVSGLTHAKECIPQHLLSTRQVYSNVNSENIVTLSSTTIAPNYPQIMEMKLQAGRWFYPNEHSISDSVWIINEKAATQLHISSKDLPVKLYDADSPDRFINVIGIITDFHFESLYEPIMPLLYYSGIDRSKYVFVKYHSGNQSRLIEDLKSLWKDNDINAPFDVVPLKEHFNSFYLKESMLGKILNSYLVVAMILALLGLIGFIQSLSIAKTKELAIRKVYGATTPVLAGYLIRYILRWAILAEVIAVPLALFFLSRWHTNFAFQAKTGIFDYVLLAFLVLVAITVISLYQVIRVSRTHPVHILRND